MARLLLKLAHGACLAGLLLLQWPGDIRLGRHLAAARQGMQQHLLRLQLLLHQAGVLVQGSVLQLEALQLQCQPALLLLQAPQRVLVHGRQLRHNNLHVAQKRITALCIVSVRCCCNAAMLHIDICGA